MRLATIGDNNPPEPTPFDLAQQAVEDVYDEAKNWLDGAKVETQADADSIGKLIDLSRAVYKQADDARAAEKKPFDDAGKEVQARYKPLLEKATLAQDTCKKALQPFLEKQDAERRAAEEALRQEAIRKQREAEEKIRQANLTDLAAREEAEKAIKEAQAAEREAKRAGNTKTQARGGARAISMRTSYEPELVDMTQAARYYWEANKQVFVEFLTGLARKDIAHGKRSIPGFKVNEVKKVV